MKNIFALDVGTRNIVGIVSDYQDDKIVVKHIANLEHETRAMEDGQIHDISKVSMKVDEIVAILKEQSGEELEEVAVAVAGRSLLTNRGIAIKELEVALEISEETLLEIELLAIQNSLEDMDNKEYHCVGYTVSEYKLDGNHIKNPLFQKGKELKIEILATFLPKVVVDSMFTAMKKSGLKIKSLTLEPIAAISVVIPEDMRKLNIALVDIGAGTSDIAISKDGKIIGYEMVPMAGDELTEKIAGNYLLEFNSAEDLKRELSSKGDTVKYTDILGLEYEIEKIEIFELLEETIGELANRIAQKIVYLNRDMPQAIIMIGGGSLISGLREKLAEAVGLPKARVAVRGTEVVKALDDQTGKLKTAEFVTPVGIVEMAKHGKGFKVVSITIDGEEYRVFSFKESITIMDALISAGIDSSELHSKHGKPLTIKVNGELHIATGESGKVAIIKVNGDKKSLDDLVTDEDVIEIKKHRAGRDAIIRVDDLEKYRKTLTVKLNGENIEMKSTLLVSGEVKDGKYRLQDREEVVINERFFLNDLEIVKNQSVSEFKVKLNGNEINLEIPNAAVKRGVEFLSGTSELFSGDELSYEEIETKFLLREIVEIEEFGEIRVKVNGEELTFKNRGKKVLVNGDEKSGDYEVKTGDSIEVLDSEENLPILSDIFSKYNPEELIKNHSGILQMEINGEKAEFITKIKNRDEIKLYYK